MLYFACNDATFSQFNALEICNIARLHAETCSTRDVNENIVTTVAERKPDSGRALPFYLVDKACAIAGEPKALLLRLCNATATSSSLLHSKQRNCWKSHNPLVYSILLNIKWMTMNRSFKRFD